MWGLSGFRDILSRVEKRIEELKPSDTAVTDVLRRTIPFESASIVDPALYRNGVNLFAGSEILDKYETSLRTIHDNNVRLAMRAEQTDSLIYPAVIYLWDETKAIQHLQKTMQQMPAMLKTVENLKRSCVDLAVQLEETEKLLDAQILEHQKIVTVRLKESLSGELQRYQLQKEQELATFKNDLLIKKHSQRLREEREAAAAAQREVQREKKILDDAKDRLRAGEADFRRTESATAASQRANADLAFRNSVVAYHKATAEKELQLQSLEFGNPPTATPTLATSTASSTLDAVVISTPATELEEFLKDEK